MGRAQAQQGRRRRIEPAALLLLPKLVAFAAFTALPFVLTFVLVLMQGTILRGFHWVGLRNLSTLVDDALFWESLRNTLVFTAWVVPANILLPCAVGLFLSSSFPGLNVYRPLIYTPSLLSVVAVGIVFKQLVNPDGGWLYSLVNRQLGLDVGWLTEPSVSIAFVALVTVWAGLGFNSVLFMAAFNAIPRDVLESARLDGANALEVIWHIKLPLVRRVILLVVVLTIIGCVQVFDLIFVMTQGGPGTATYTAMWYIFQNVFNGGSLGYAAAMGIVIFAITATFSLIAKWFTRESA